MNDRADPPIGGRGPVARRRRRWLLGLEPFFEGGWLHKDRRAPRWDVEEKIFALALLGDVTVDLAGARSIPAEVDIEAWAILRDVDVLVPEGTHVELTGGGPFGELKDEAPALPPGKRERVVRIHGHALSPFSDITVRVAS